MKTRVEGSKNVLTDSFIEYLNGVTTARIDMYAGDGNLTVDQLTHGEQVLASGTMEHLENQGLPIRTVESSNGQATLTLRAGRSVQPRFRLPWVACNGATEWQIHLNPTLPIDITAHSDGGNVMLNLTGMAVNRVSVDTGGGNIEVVMPDKAANLYVNAETVAGEVTVMTGNGITGSNIVKANTGGGNVLVRIPSECAARIHATTGLGKVMVDPSFRMTDKNLFQSSDYEIAVNKLDITVSSGVGNVMVNAR